MEETPEGLAVARATREAAKRKREDDELASLADTPASRKQAITTPPPVVKPTHDVALPSEGYDVEGNKGLDQSVHGTMHDPFFAGDMAKQYPFTLDPFQSTAIACLERHESVLVAAHTSAGKTVVAEYAIAMAFRDKQRVIYTSPLKALSNQKFRELSEEFEDVGLMTGDVTINPNANCIVMTTEILRAMIYRGGELLREVAWVVFDEIHYMQDRERGVVWEETIIFLPHEVKMVFLSATLSNAKEFAEWVAHLHKQPCHVVYTDFRPTPLQHYAFPVGGKGLHLLVDEGGNFRAKNFEKMQAQMGPNEADLMEIDQARDGADGNGAAGAPSTSGRGEGGRGRGGKGGRDGGRDGGRGGRDGGRGGRDGGRGGRGGKAKKKSNQVDAANKTKDVVRLVTNVQELDWEPLIVFSFSRRDCESYALAVANKATINFNSDEEQQQVEEVFKNAVQCLSPEDQSLRPLEQMLKMVKRGIGVHHSGLLPILKELTEILFQEQLIKVLFATETFAMGLNMPARSVVFTSLQKFDGTEQRWMRSGEYIQMSGRAGRRGKDARGHVIMMLDEEVTQDTCMSIVKGNPSPLQSSFKLSYYTLLNLMRRTEGSSTDTMEFVIAHSFQQFQQERAAPQLQSELEQVLAEANALQVEGQEHVADYKRLRKELILAEDVFYNMIIKPKIIVPFLKPGRLIRVRTQTVDWGWGALVSAVRRAPAAPATPPPANGAAAAAGNKEEEEEEDKPEYYLLDVAIPCDPQSMAQGVPRPARPGDQKADLQILPVGLPLLRGISPMRVDLPGDLRPPQTRQQLLLKLCDITDKHPRFSLPRTDPKEDMHIADADVHKAYAAMRLIETQLQNNPVYQAELDSSKFALFLKKAALEERAAELKRSLNVSQLAVFREETHNRLAVLRRLGHVDEQGVVQLKGKAACEIDTADELLVVELLFNGAFSSLDPHQMVALVSCLVQVDRSVEETALKPHLAEPLAELQETARYIASVNNECKMEVDVEEFVETFRPHLMDVIYAWSKGATFGEICKMTDIFEGSIIRSVRRMDELMQQLVKAAKVLGDEGLAARIEESNLLIRRDIMFAASLYI